jgi:CarD family transcriptional regulator
MTNMAGFSVGDILVYPAYGIVEIKQKESTEVAGSRVECYVLETLERRKSIKVPARSAEKSGLRRLFDAEELDRVYEVLKRPGGQYELPWYERFKVNEARLRSGDLLEVAAVVRDLWFIREVKQKNSKEFPLQKEATNFLLSELAYIEKKRKGDILEKIKYLMKQKAPLED